MMHHSALLLPMVILPLAGAFVLGVLRLATVRERGMAAHHFGIIAAIGPLLSFLLALGLLVQINGLSGHDRVLSQSLYQWFAVGEMRVNFGLMADPLAVLMVLFVTFVGSLIHIYSIGYMKGDPNAGAFFAYLNLFLGAMLILVLGSGPLVMFVGWEGVGLCSYLLISYYNDDRANVAAGNKAFIVNRIGDLGFILGLALLFWAIGDTGFDYADLRERAPELTPLLALTVGLLLFIGATGKSAQLPLYVWLPDAMAGPTPVSALIHAATMVTAGVYMVARFSFLYMQSVPAGVIIAWVGILTALLGAIFGMFQRDIKKILAYSTISQLGYMFVGVGLTAYSAGIFHVFTHAFFKALLFLGAGSVITALHHQQDIWRMGGLKKRLPITYVTMLIGALALAGVPPLAGFFSKDEILVAALATGHPVIWLLGILVAGMTAYYTFRLIFVVFHGTPRDAHYEEVTESPRVMTIPLMILAAGAVLAGFINLPPILGGHQLLSHWLGLEAHHSPHIKLELLTILTSLTVCAVGIGIAYRRFIPTAVEPVYHGFARFAEAKFHVDELYDSLFIQPLLGAGAAIRRVVEPRIVDGPVQAVVWLYRAGADAVSAVQSGYVRVYAVYMVVGVGLLSFAVYRLLVG
jgi:NADH-quinone oxidoreductase subunit L